VTIARAVELAADGAAVRVTRVTPDGDEVVEASLPAVVTVSNELGTPRYPTAARKIQARRVKPTVVTADSLGLGTADLAPKIAVIRQFVPHVQGHCEFLPGAPAEAAQALVERLAQQGGL
jgi:electron transfer flavoprotein beta subunit